MNRTSRHSNYGRKHASQKVIKVTNIRLLRDHKLVEEDLWIRNGTVIDPMKRFWEAQSEKEFVADEIIDGKGCIVSPGFIDVQINGGFGVDFSNPDVTTEDVEFVSRSLLRHGCTAYLPTLVSSSPDVYKKVLPLLRPRPASVDVGAAVLGAHCEGPFISEHKFGAHRKSSIATPRDGYRSVEDMYGADNLPRSNGIEASVRLVTMAPELDGAIEAGSYLRERGVLVSAGHSNASVNEAVKAVDRGGFTMLTHLFNAMPSFHHRDPGLVGLLGCNRIKDKLFYSLIADGIHSHAYSASMAISSHPSGLVLITDAMAAMGLPDGEHQLGEMKVNVSGHRAVLSGTDTLAGSVTSMDACVRTLVKMVHCSPVVALEAATLHPAQALGIADTKGTLRPGSDGDFVMLSDDLNVMATYIGGACAWRMRQ